jgi:hypothetical protein
VEQAARVYPALLLALLTTGQVVVAALYLPLVLKEPGEQVV